MNKIFTYILPLLLLPAIVGAEPANINEAEQAIKDGNTVALQQMIENGLDLNARDAAGNSLVYFAVTNSKSLKVLRILADNGADLDAPSAATGETPLIYIVATAERIQDEVKQVYAQNLTSQKWQEKKDNLEKIAAAEMIHAVKTLKLMIDLGADINLETPFGTPLMKAAANPWNSEMVKILTDAGADVNQPDQSGRTALFYAEANGCTDITMQLIAAGSDVYHQDVYGKTYLEINKEDFKKEEIIHDM